MDFLGIGASNGWMAGCFECTTRAVASHLQGRQDWYAFSDIGVSGMVPWMRETVLTYRGSSMALLTLWLVYRDPGSMDTATIQWAT
jgi:hypothetical protein